MEGIFRFALLASIILLVHGSIKENDVTNHVYDVRVNTSFALFDCLVLKPVCPNKYVTFYLYTRKTQDSPHKIKDRNLKSLKLAPFKKAPLVLLIHGFNGNANNSLNDNIRPALFEHGEYNVISVDFHKVAKIPCYISLVKSAPVIAECVAQFLNWIYKVRKEVSCRKTHIIGFSLGSHVAGIAGQLLRRKYGCVLPWITGLDPANPLFPSAAEDKDSVIDASDADFVDVIHSSVNVEGQCGPSGHVDFYINKGYDQPDCLLIFTPCSHRYATAYYAQSIINASTFNGISCELNTDCLGLLDVCIPTDDETPLKAGYHVPHTARGTYRVGTY